MLQHVEGRMRITLCATDEDAAAVREAGIRSVRVVTSVDQIMATGTQSATVDPSLAMFTEFVLVFPSGTEDLRDQIALRLGDVNCRWVQLPENYGTAAAVVRTLGTKALATALACARPMWTDEISRLSDIPEPGETIAYKTGIKGLDDEGIRVVRPMFWPIIGPYGPLPGSAEFHTRDGWKRLDAWVEGDEALVYDLDTSETSYEVVGRVVADAPDGFLRLANNGTVDIRACAQHRWPVVGKGGACRVMTTAQLAECGQGEHGSGYSLIRTFSPPDLPDLPVSDDHIRLQVAICADGSIRRRSVNGRVSICIRKERKKNRIKTLLDRAGVTYRTRSYSERPTEEYFDFDFNEDKRLSQFRNASPRQLEIVFDELQHWDGHVYENRGAGRLVMSTSDLNDAAFLEYLYSACGFRASVFIQNGNPEVQRDNHLVCANTKGRLSRVKWDRVEQAPSEDGKKYCLTTSKGYFVCRLAPGQIYVTGNSGKSVLARQLVANFWKLHGWRTLVTVFEEKVKPRMQRDFRRHFCDHAHRIMTTEDDARADAEIEKALMFLRRPRRESLDANRLFDRIEFACRVYGLDVVMIDPVNEIDHQVGRGESKTDYMGRFMMNLKALADDYNLIVMVLAHPPKDGVAMRNSKGKIYTLNDGADTAHYGNKADMGWCVWRPFRDLGATGGNEPMAPTFLNIDKCKDHEVMGKPTFATLRLQGCAFSVGRIGMDAYHEIVGE